MRKIIDLVLRTQDEKERIQFWHVKDIDLESIKFKDCEKLTIPKNLQN